MPKTKTAYILLFRGVGGATQLPDGPAPRSPDRGGVRERRHLHQQRQRRPPQPPFPGEGDRLGREDLRGQVRVHQGDLRPDAGGVGNPDREQPVPRLRSGPKHLHAAVLAGDPTKEAIEGLRAYAVEGERIEVVGRVAYLHTPNGFGTSKLGEKFDKGIGVANTARNWNTVLKLLELARKAAG